MSGATLAQAKLHLHVEHDEEDAAIQQMLDAALAYLGSIGVSLETPLPAPVVSAQLLLVARLFTNRGEALDGAFRDDPTWKMLVLPYRSFLI